MKTQLSLASELCLPTGLVTQLPSRSTLPCQSVRQLHYLAHALVLLGREVHSPLCHHAVGGLGVHLHSLVSGHCPISVSIPSKYLQMNTYSVN